MPEPLTSSDFAPHLHSIFKVEASLPLTLTEIADRSNAQLEQFSLIFAGPATPQLQQATHSLIHEQMGEIEIFLVPLGPAREGMLYEAVFTRLKDRDPKTQEN